MYRPFFSTKNHIRLTIKPFFKFHLRSMGHVNGVQQHGAPVTITQAMIITSGTRVTLSDHKTVTGYETTENDRGHIRIILENTDAAL